MGRRVAVFSSTSQPANQPASQPASQPTAYLTKYSKWNILGTACWIFLRVGGERVGTVRDVALTMRLSASYVLMGRGVRSVLQRSNLLETAGCDTQDCLPCKHGRGEGGNCEGCGINYEIECQICPDGERSVYIGETSRNLYTRSSEHVSRYRGGKMTSFMFKHQQNAHQGEQAMYSRGDQKTQQFLSKLAL
jgi:hypothetical protein